MRVLLLLLWWGLSRIQPCNTRRRRLRWNHKLLTSRHLIGKTYGLQQDKLARRWIHHVKVGSSARHDHLRRHLLLLLLLVIELHWHLWIRHTGRKCSELLLLLLLLRQPKLLLLGHNELLLTLLLMLLRQKRLILCIGYHGGIGDGT